MKKTKKLFISVLILVLCVCTAIPTYSWYDHAGTQQGGDIKINEYYDVSGYNKDVTMVTYGGAVASNGRIVYKTDQELTDLTTTVESGDSAYFKTIISNQGADASVGLFLNNICDDAINSKVYIGSTSPIYTRRAFVPSASASKSIKNTMRVYFQPRDNTSWANKSYYVFYYKTDDKYTKVQMEYAGEQYSSTNGKYFKSYYADIPEDTKGLFFSCENNVNAEGANRTQLMTDVASDGLDPLCCVCYYLSDRTNNYYNPEADKFTMNDTSGGTIGANILNYYNKIYGDRGSSVSIALTQFEDYTGTKVSYSSSNPAVASVDPNSGLVTIKEGTAVGSTCTITTKVNSKYSDVCEVETLVTVVNSSSTLPVAENLKIEKDGSIEVCWFVKNTTDQAIEFSAAGLVISL